MTQQQLYQKEIKKVVKRLREQYKPDKVILFGSGARNEIGPDSDLDFFIIKRTQKPRLDRMYEVDGLFFDREVPMDFLIYTPKEVKTRLLLGDLFVKEIINQGKVLYEQE